MFQKIKMWLYTFMQGRHGVDALSKFTLILGLVFYFLSMFVFRMLFSTIGLALYIYTLYRMFSKNNEQRNAENQKYVALSSTYTTRFKQFKTRVKNRKVYKYFRCPKCKAMLRLTRGCGTVDVTCGRCKHVFKEKA